MEVKHLKLYGTRITPLSIDELNEFTVKTISESGKQQILSLNLHSLYLQFKNPELNKIQNESVMRIDGMPIVWLANQKGYRGVSRRHRVTWMDWKESFFDMCNTNKFNIFYLGSKPELKVRIEQYMDEKYQDLSFKCSHGYFQLSSKEEEELLSQINQFKPDILLVGMGMPRQEYWISTNASMINANLIMSCGAAMEYIVGYVSEPPRWMGRLGLEWLYRLVEKPGRFFHRYLVEPWVLLYYMITYKKNKWRSTIV